MAHAGNTVCGGIVNGTTIDIDSALVDCAPTTFTNIALQAKNANVTYSNLRLDNPTFSFQGSPLGIVVVEGLVMWGLTLDQTLFSFPSLAPGGTITFRNNSITAGSAKNVLFFPLTTVVGSAATVSIVGNRVLYSVTGTSDHYVTSVSAVIDPAHLSIFRTTQCPRWEEVLMLSHCAWCR